MSRAVFVLTDAEVRARVHKLISHMPVNSRVELKEPKRSLSQNDRMWAMLTDIARQAEHMGRQHAPEVWKRLFMHELGDPCDFVPSLDGSKAVPIGYQTSKLSVAEMNDLMTIMEEWGTRHNIIFHTPREVT